MNYLIGAELNSNQIKLTALRKVGSSFEIAKLDKFTVTGDINDISKKLTSWRDTHLSDASSIKVIASISESVLYIKELDFPKIQSEKLSNAIYWELPSVAPIPQSEAVFDWYVISETKDTVKSLVFVCKSIYVENIISSFQKAQMDVVAIEPSSFSFARVANAPLEHTTLVCLVQEYGTEFIVLKNGIPYFTTSTTGNMQSEKLSRVKSGSDLIAEIKDEANRIINYWEQKSNSKIDQILFSGDLVYKYFGYSVTLNPFPPKPSYICQIKKVSNLNTGEYKELDLANHIISFGAAIRLTQKNYLEGVNIFPQSEKQKSVQTESKKKLAGNLLLFIYVNVALIAFLIVSIIGFNLWWYSLEKDQELLNNRLINHPANSLIKEVNDTNRVIDSIITLTRQQQNFGIKLSNISDNTPQNMTIRTINFSNAREPVWVIEGVGDRESILAYFKKIETNLKDTSVSMPYSNFNSDTDNEFSIQIVW